MLSTVDTPLFRSVLTIQGVCDLEQIHAVQAGIDSLVAFVIGTAVQHLIIYNQIIITE